MLRRLSLYMDRPRRLQVIPLATQRCWDIAYHVPAHAHSSGSTSPARSGQVGRAILDFQRHRSRIQHGQAATHGYQASVRPCSSWRINVDRGPEGCSSSHSAALRRSVMGITRRPRLVLLFRSRKWGTISRGDLGTPTTRTTTRTITRMTGTRTKGIPTVCSIPITTTTTPHSSRHSPKTTGAAESPYSASAQTSS